MDPGGEWFGKRGTHGSPALCHQSAADGKNERGNESSPAPREQLEVCSQRGPESTCLLHPDGAGMGSTAGIASHRRRA